MLKFILPTEQNKIEVLSFYRKIENNSGVFEDKRYFSENKLRFAEKACVKNL